MDKIDLHTHSNCSDGSMTPTQLVNLAAESGLAAIALTDHDSTSGLHEAIGQGKKIGVEVLSGVEFSLFHEDTAIHLLAYGFDPDHPAINGLVRKVQGIRDSRNEGILDRFNSLGIKINRDELLLAAKGQLGRPHFAAYLVRHGVARNIQDAFNRYLKRGGPAYVPRQRFNADEAMAEIIRAGGLPVLAHPGVISRSPKVMAGVIRALKEQGLSGVEVLYPAHDNATIKYLTDLAGDLDLLITGGSDFHGDSKPDIRLGGTGLMPPVPITLLENLKERLTHP